MLKRFRKLRDDIERFLPLEEQIEGLDAEEWRQLDYLIELLKPFSWYTEAIGATESGPTIQNVFEVYNHLFSHIEQHTEKLRRKRIPWKVKMRQALENSKAKLSQYYSLTRNNIGLIYGCATILAPQYKLAFFETDDWEDTVNWVSSLISAKIITSLIIFLA